MLVDLTAEQIADIKANQQNFAERLYQFGTEENDLEAIEYAKERLESLKEESNWLIKHDTGIYSYIESAIANNYSWEISEFTFSDEFRNIFQQAPADGWTDDATHQEWLDRLHNPERPVDYGVCDTPDQIVKRFPALLTDERKFIIKVSEVHKADQSPRDGWRWHKWGPYIGDGEPQCEYLYDEEGFDTVILFQIIHVEG